MCIRDRVTAETGVTLEQMRGPSQVRQFCDARNRAWRLSHDIGKTNAQIGTFFHRDTSTIWNGVARDRKANPEAAELMDLAIQHAAKLAVQEGVGPERLHNRIMDAYREAQS